MYIHTSNGQSIRSNRRDKLMIETRIVNKILYNVRFDDDDDGGALKCNLTVRKVVKLIHEHGPG